MTESPEATTTQDWADYYDARREFVEKARSGELSIAESAVEADRLEEWETRLRENEPTKVKARAKQAKQEQLDREKRIRQLKAERVRAESQLPKARQKAVNSEAMAQASTNSVYWVGMAAEKRQAVIDLEGQIASIQAQIDELG